MTPSAFIMAKLEGFEAMRAIAYSDQVGIPTAGWGHTGPEVIIGNVYPLELCRRWLAADSALAAHNVDMATRAGPTSQAEFDAMFSLTFNIGVGGFRGSSVLRLHRLGLKSQAADAFLLWDKDHIDGKLVESVGLLARRNAERLIYLDQDQTL